MVKANNSSYLKEFGGTIGLTDRWARDFLDSLEWNKRKGATGKLNHRPILLQRENMFQRPD